MVDVVDSATRSRMMAGIKNKNTKPERLIRSALHKKGFRFRIHAAELPGKPDIYLPKYKSVIFINGCFWHGHSCHLFKWPATRSDFWFKKITKNRSKDQSVLNALLNLDFKVGVVWECALRDKNKGIDHITDQLEFWLKNNIKILEITK